MSEESGKYEVNGSSAKVWDREAARYDAPRQEDAIYKTCVDQIVRMIPENTPICLDAGCGTGISSLALALRCDSVVAADYSGDSLYILKQKRIGNIVTIQSDITSLPFEDSCFDAAMCANTLQHLRPGHPQEQAISELRRVTKNGGVVAVSVHHYSRNKVRAGWVKEGNPGQAEIDYIYRFSRRELADLMPRASIRGVGFYLLLKMPFFKRLIQSTTANVVGKIAGMLGYGHMLVAVEKNIKSSS